MQDCFRQYPEIYGAELAEDDEAEAAAPAVEAPAKTYEGGAEQETSVGSAPAVNAPAADASEAVQQKAEATPDFPVQAEVTPADADEASGSFPKKSYDATAANAGKTEK
jgi:intermembrane space import and assembly protein 40